MEVEDVSQAFITAQAFSGDTGVEKRHEEDTPTCNREDDAAPAAPLNGCFDCNICLDFVVDPVVTLCGHLYCWPCIYRWMQAENSTAAHQQCPVCKAFLSPDTVVPLYGRGGDCAKADSDVPHRPVLHFPCHHAGATPLQQPQIPRRNQFQSYTGSGAHEMFDPSLPLGAAPLFRSTAGGVIGGLAIAILPWVCRDGAARAYPANPPYFLTLSGNSPRLRRQQMQVESSLHQIWLFLFCCAVLCLLLF